MKKKFSVIGASTIISVLILMQASMVYATPVGIIEFAKFPAYPYNTTAYMQGGAYVGCGPTTGAMIFGYFQHHFGLTGLLTSPVAGVNEGLNTAWALHGASYMNTASNGFGSVYNIKPGLENYAADRGFQVKVMAHAATDENPATSWYNDYGPYGVAWTNDGIFWQHPGGVWNIDPNLFCDFVAAKLSSGICVFLTVDSDNVEGGDHWIPCVGYDKATSKYYYYNTYDTTVHSAPIAYYERTPGAGDYAISFVRTVEYIPAAKVNTQITFTFSPNPANPGQSVVLSGTLKTVGGSAVYPAAVTVKYSKNGGATWISLWTLNTNSAGTFSRTFTAPAAGTYPFTVSYAGSATYNPSSNTQTLTVQTGAWTYNFRMSPGTDVLHFNLKGSVIYGVAENSVGAYPYANAPVIGYIDAGSFCLFIDGPDKTPPFFELVMMVGSTSTWKGQVYQTMDGTSWNGPVAYTLVPVASTQPSSSEQVLASPLTAKLETWPATYNFRLNPFVDVLHLSLDGQVIHGLCDAASYTNQPILGWKSGGKDYVVIDYTKNNDGSEILYELGMNVVSASTLKGNLYRTVDGKSVVGPTAVTFTLIPP